MATKMNLQDKVVIITGGTKGIGLAVAKRVTSAGAIAVLNYSSDESAASSAVASLPENRAVAIKGDAGSPAAMKELVEETKSKYGRIDVVIANAGIMRLRPLEAITEADFDVSFNLNVKGPLFLTQAAAPHMSAGGRVVFISTGVAKSSAVVPAYAVYAATKGAVEQLTRALSKQLGAKGITVNAVAPGPTDTELFRQGKSDEMIAGIASAGPQKRIGTPDEVAEVIAFVAGPESSWVSGQTIHANGAMFV